MGVSGQERHILAPEAVAAGAGVVSGPAVTKRTRLMVEAYEFGATLAEVGRVFGVTKSRAHAVIKRHAPSAMRPPTATRFPSAGKPGEEIYRVGSCKKCEVALFAYRPEPRVLCGHCITITGTLL